MIPAPGFQNPMPYFAQPDSRIVQPTLGLHGDGVDRGTVVRHPGHVAHFLTHTHVRHRQERARIERLDSETIAMLCRVTRKVLETAIRCDPTTGNFIECVPKNFLLPHRRSGESYGRKLVTA